MEDVSGEEMEIRRDYLYWLQDREFSEAGN
jgi:hypothetical protein